VPTTVNAGRSVRLLSLVAALVLLAGTAACSDDDQSAATNDAAAVATAPVATVAARTTTAASPMPPTVASAGTSGDVVDLVQAVQGSVVKVTVSGQTSTPFGRGATQQGTGTGFIVDAGGAIVTNNHVVTMGGDRQATTIRVTLSDGRELDASIVGTDPRTDLAVVQVATDGLRPLPFADPKSILVGQMVVAIGYALDLGSTPTVTTGVISATDRVIEEQTTSISGAIQTDAAINPGNSGGPLLNLRGEVVGVNTAGLTGGSGQSVQGIFFAVSAQVAEPVVQELLADGVVDRGYLGVTVQQIGAGAARARGLAAGAYVVQVASGSPADRAGIRAGDVITKLGDMPITNGGGLTNALARYRAGAQVPVEVARSNERLTFQLTLGSPPK
jgi:S1-C subfamily serine protease